MTTDPSTRAVQWVDATLAATLLAVDPASLHGVALRAPAGPARDMWVSQLRDLLPAGLAVHRLPLSITDDRLLGGLDLTATLRSGRRVVQSGLLASANRGLVIVPMAERLAPPTARQIAAVIDTGVVRTEREGLSLKTPSQFITVACDEGIGEDEQLCDALRDRLAFHLDLSAAGPNSLIEPEFDRNEVALARERLPLVEVSDAAIEALCAAALALGIRSPRAVMFAIAVARSSAALDASPTVRDTDLAAAGRLVLAPRATRLPAPAADQDEPDSAEDTADDGQDPTPPTPPEDQSDDSKPDSATLEDVLLNAVTAALPDDLLAKLDQAAKSNVRHGAAGNSGTTRPAALRGRPIGHRQGTPGSGHRLDIIATLRQAAPWQPMRRAERQRQKSSTSAPLIELRRDDMRIKRFAQSVSQTTVFVVDASGSAAFQRLGEAKGAVELLLADCYIRRDRVALIAFRGDKAELLLSPTRSLTRARRALASLPGGGGTPLAAGLTLASDVAETIARQDETAVIVLLTDGGANIASDGLPGRPRAEADALASAQRLKAAGLRSLLIDTATRPQPLAKRVAEAMNAMYITLPNADASSISTAARVLDDRQPHSNARAGRR